LAVSCPAWRRSSGVALKLGLVSIWPPLGHLYIALSAIRNLAGCCARATSRNGEDGIYSLCMLLKDGNSSSDLGRDL
jgi:hypothetical protein